MKNKLLTKTAITLGLTVIMVLSANIVAIASTDTTPPTVARTKAWDAIEYTLGGVPKSVIKIEYAGSVFYLGKDVTETDFLTVLAAGPEAVKLNPPRNNGKLYNYPVYILWNSDKTVLLVHPITSDYDNLLEPVAVQTAPPASLTGSQAISEKAKSDLPEAQADTLSAEYADAVRNEFYRLLNEHRADNGLRELEIDFELQKYADIRVNELRTSYSHTRPDGSYAGSGWYNSYNHMNSRYAENIVGVGSLGLDPVKTANSIFTCWKESKDHNRHMLYNFDTKVKMAFGIVPKLDEKGFVTSAAVFATGY